MAESPGPDTTSTVNEKIQQTHTDTNAPNNDSNPKETSTNSKNDHNEISNISNHEPSDPEKNSDTDSANGLDRWNTPRINTYRFCVVNFSLFIMGFNDASLGALLPYVCSHLSSCPPLPFLLFNTRH